MLKSILFLGKAHLGNFYAHLAIFFWSHCSLVIYLGANPGKRLENKISSKLLFSFSSAASSGLKQLKQKSAKRSCLRSFVGLLLVLFAQKGLCRWQHHGRRGWVCPPPFNLKKYLFCPCDKGRKDIGVDFLKNIFILHFRDFQQTFINNTNH